mmetsp:Transcript_113336/g.293388  ORF Transcript_113336/g.293388 Transcript_113336/m.293388 type:complete len:202 (+) Transcript_113336:313-918(+)
MPRRACSAGEKRCAKLTGTSPVRKPACQASARRSRPAGESRLQVMYCTSRHSLPSFGQFSCGIRESHTNRPPRGTITFVRRSCISSSKGTGNGTVVAVTRLMEPSGWVRLQFSNSLWKPGTVAKPPVEGSAAESATKPCMAKKPGFDQGFWSQCNQFLLVLQSGRSPFSPGSLVGRITPNRSTETTSLPSSSSSSAWGLSW